MKNFGLIETIKVANGRPVFKNLHISRLQRSLEVIQIRESAFKLEDRLLRLLKYECIENSLKNFRLRIEIQKNNLKEYATDSTDLKWNCTLKPIDDIRYTWNNDGLKLTFLPKHYKTIDIFSSLKHTERNIYTKANAYAASLDFDTALVLNENKTIADADIYNVFMIKGNCVFTPPLSCAPVAGVFRSLLLNIPSLKIVEQAITLEDLYQADEIFLTNAIRGIQWVNCFDDKILASTQTQELFKKTTSFIAEHYGEHLI